MLRPLIKMTVMIVLYFISVRESCIAVVNERRYNKINQCETLKKLQQNCTQTKAQNSTRSICCGFVVQQVAQQIHNKYNESSFSCWYYKLYYKSATCDKFYNLLYNKSTTNRTSGVSAQVNNIYPQHRNAPFVKV
jgi:hypothetical protein